MVGIQAQEQTLAKPTRPYLPESHDPLGLLENWHLSVPIPHVGKPWTTVRWGWQSLTLPIPSGPLWPGSNRPVAGWELFILG